MPSPRGRVVATSRRYGACHGSAHTAVGLSRDRSSARSTTPKSKPVDRDASLAPRWAIPSTYVLGRFPLGPAGRRTEAGRRGAVRRPGVIAAQNERRRTCPVALGGTDAADRCWAGRRRR